MSYVYLDTEVQVTSFKYGEKGMGAQEGKKLLGTWCNLHCTS